MITMTRRLAFSAAHSDWIETLTPDENRAIFGLYARPEPYGHNYVLDVAVSGEIDRATGMLVNIKDIDRIVRERVLSRIDRKYLNREVAELRAKPVTPECLSWLIARWLEPHLPPEVRLAAITLEPDPLVRVELPLPFEELPCMQITHVYEFSASHRLHSDALTPEQNIEMFGKCNNANGHGHNYVLEVTVQGPINARTGRVIDPAALDAVVNREVVDRYDHRHLNEDIPEFNSIVPSAEWITRIIWDRLKDHIPSPARLSCVHLKETARNLFEYRGEDDA